jgi:hypothetical protein
MDDGAWFRFVFHTEISHNGEKETKPRFSRLKRPLEIVESNRPLTASHVHETKAVVRFAYILVAFWRDCPVGG